MKQKWLDLTLGQKVIFCLQIFLIVLFLILYNTVGRQQIINYRNATLRCRTDGAVTTYSGKLDGKEAMFTVSDHTVTYQIGGTVYGPYNIVFDPTAVPSEENKPINLTSTKGLIGVEIWNGDLKSFRGAYRSSGSTFYLVASDGEMILTDNILTEILSSTGNGTVTTYVSAEEPGPYAILKVAVAPNVTQRANPLGLLCGIILCVTCIVSLLFADYFFRRNLSFRIRNPEDAEPSDWELSSRWISWLTLTGIAILLFILGLTGM